MERWECIDCPMCLDDGRGNLSCVAEDTDISNLKSCPLIESMGRVQSEPTVNPSRSAPIAGNCSLTHAKEFENVAT